MDEYKADYDKYVALLASAPEPEEPAGDFSALQNFLSSNFSDIYETLTREERRSMWRGIIKSIRVDARNSIAVFFE